MDWLSGPFPLIIGHRGDNSHAPENTIAAFALALEQGAHGVELDVRLSADGNVMVIHDATVDRTTDGTGYVSRLSTNALRRLNAGMGQAVPTLDDVFQAFGPAMLYNIELKESGLKATGLVGAVADRIDAYHLHNQVVVSSFNPLSLRRARRQLSQTTMTGFLWMRGPRLLRRLLATQAQADHPYYPLVDEAYMVWARDRGLRVHTWTVDEEHEARRLAALGVHALITNRPRAIAAALEDIK